MSREWRGDPLFTPALLLGVTSSCSKSQNHSQMQAPRHGHRRAGGSRGPASSSPYRPYIKLKFLKSHLVLQSHWRQLCTVGTVFGGGNLEKWVVKAGKPGCAASGRAKLGSGEQACLGALWTLGRCVLEACSAAREGRPRHSPGKFHLTSNVFDLHRMTFPLKPSPFEIIRSHGSQQP